MLGSVIHSMTGQKIPVQIHSKQGNRCTYESILKLDVGQAELCQQLIEENKPLPVRPNAPDKCTLTHFWWDNFDCKKENIQGNIHTTHGIAFQEISFDS